MRRWKAQTVGPSSCQVLCKVYFEDPQRSELGKGVYGLSALKFPQGDSELGDLGLFSQTSLISFPTRFLQANLSPPATSGLCDSSLLVPHSCSQGRQRDARCARAWGQPPVGPQPSPAHGACEPPHYHCIGGNSSYSPAFWSTGNDLSWEVVRQASLSLQWRLEQANCTHASLTN